MPGGPPINTPVTLDVAGWAEPLGSRVEGLDEMVAVADPLLGATDHDPSLGSSVKVSWSGDRGPCEMPTILACKDAGRVRMWRLRPDGPVVITQRRHHVRVSTLLPLTVDAESGPMAGHLVDLSEGGLNWVSSLPSPVVAGDRLVVRFDVDGHLVAVDATAVRIERHDDHTYVGCRFIDTGPRHADVIRRFIFERQLKERRLRDGR